MKALIFGANGQDGHYLQEKCLLRGIEPIPVSRSGNGIKADVSCYDQVKALIQPIKPTYIFHLAANSSTKHEALLENHDTISTGTLNILELVKQYSPKTKIFITGSGLQFKNEGHPIAETDPFDASSAYALARIQSVHAARYYRQLGIATYIGYLFHHESPLRKSHHISQIIISGAKQIASGQAVNLSLGDISVKKEWTFAGDIAEAMLTLIEQDNIFEATIGSGLIYSIEDWLALTFQTVKLNWRDYITLRKDFIPEYKILVSNPQTIQRLGWFPTVNIEKLNKMMLAHEAESAR